MYDDLTLGPLQDGAPREPGRVRGGRVKLSWLSWEAAAFLAVSAIVAVILSVRLEVEDEGPSRGKTSGGHDQLLEALALDTHRDVLVSSGADGTVRFWDLDPSKPTWGEEVLSLPHESHPYAVAPSPDGRFLAVGGASHLTIWRNGEEGWEPETSKEGTDYRYLAFSPDSQLLAIGGEGGEVSLFEVPSMREVRVLKGLTDMVHGVAFSPNGSEVAATSFRGELRTWDAKSGAELPLGRKVGRTHCFAYSPDGRTLATAPWLEGGRVTLWDVVGGRARSQIGDDRGCNALAFSPGGGQLATAGTDQTIKLWDVDSGEVLGALDQGVGWVKTVVFTQQGSRLAYGGRDGSIRFWNVPSISDDKRVGTVGGKAKSKAG